MHADAGGATPEGQHARPEGREMKPEGPNEGREPEGQRAVNRDGVPCAAHTHMPHRALKVPEGRTGSAWVTRATGGVRQPAAALIATSPEALRLLLERRRQEARARLLVREQARRWELWRRWAWCRGSCGAAVLQAGGRGMMARRRARAERVGAGEGWLVVAGWRHGLVPLGADIVDICAELETNAQGGGTSSCEVEAGVQPGHGARSTGAAGVISEVQAAGTLQAAARAWLVQRRVAAEMARVRAELDEPGWLRASALELEKLLQAEAAGAGAAPTGAEAAATEAAAAAASASGKARRRAETRAGRKRAARAARTARAGEVVATQARAEAAAEERLAAEAEAEAEATARAAAGAVAAAEAEAEARLAARAAVRMALAAARAAEAEEAAAVEAVARAAEEAHAAVEAAAEAETMARVAAEAAGAAKAAAAASTKARRALPRAARGRPGGRGAGGVGAEVVMAEEMAAEANRHARRMAAWAEEARAAEAAMRASVGGEAHWQAGARARAEAHEAGGGGWRAEVRRNLEAAFARAASQQEGA